MQVMSISTESGHADLQRTRLQYEENQCLICLVP